MTYTQLTWLEVFWSSQHCEAQGPRATNGVNLVLSKDCRAAAYAIETETESRVNQFITAPPETGIKHEFNERLNLTLTERYIKDHFFG